MQLNTTLHLSLKKDGVSKRIPIFSGRSALIRLYNYVIQKLKYSGIREAINDGWVIIEGQTRDELKYSHINIGFK